MNSAASMPKTGIGFGKTSLPCRKRAGATSISSNTRQGQKKAVWMFNERGELLITELSPEGSEHRQSCEINRTDPRPIEPAEAVLRGAHPAFAYKHVFVRNDNELVCANLAKTTK